MLVKFIEETILTKEYEIRVDDDGSFNPAEYQIINDNIKKYGFKVSHISGGTKVIYLTLEKIERKEHDINL